MESIPENRFHTVGPQHNADIPETANGSIVGIAGGLPVKKKVRIKLMVHTTETAFMLKHQPRSAIGYDLECFQGIIEISSIEYPEVLNIGLQCR